MKIVYGKTLSQEENCIVNNVANECDILFDTARLLYYRNINTVEKAKAFLNAGKKWFNNPFLLDGMKDAVERILLAKQRNENVFIFGDYDADGVCATTILYFCLRDFGIEARKFVPEREGNYGLNIQTVTQFDAQQKIDLLITVDCGISDGDKIEEFKKMGIDVIVTDHHEPPEILPDCIKINPKIAGQQYPCKELCGAGVAYKLASALINQKADDYLDFVALATVADSMDLVGENRDLVVEGLKIFNDKKSLRLPFKLLLADYNKQITAQTLAFLIAPRINAGGRMGDAETALKLFTTSNANQVFDLAVKLNNYNTARQAECDKIYREAKYIIETNSLQKDNIILVADQNWRTGFIGIVAAKLVEDYARPVIVFAGSNGDLKGSARSVDGINIYEVICSAKDLLLTFGGHSQAAGVSVTNENFSKLKVALNDYITNNHIKIENQQKVLVDWQMDEPINMRFARELEYLEPCGVGNRRPLFSVKTNDLLSLPLRANSPHYSFNTAVMNMLDFNGEKNVEILSMPIEKDLVFEVNLSTFKNKETVKGYLKNVVLNDAQNNLSLPYLFCNQLNELANGKQNQLNEKDVIGLENLSVDRQDFIGIFTKICAFSGNEFTNAVDFCIKYLPQENLYQSVFVLKVFIELGIFSVVDARLVFNQKVKNALTNSKLYSKIYSLKV